MKHLLACCLLLSAAAGATTRYVDEPQREGTRLWEELEQSVWDGKASPKEARARFKELWPQVSIDDKPSDPVNRWQWAFPLPGYDAEAYGLSYAPEGYRFYDGPQAKGYPALNIYIRDRQRRGLDDRDGKPVPVVACRDGVVVSARRYWEPSDANPLGVYVCVFDQEQKLFFYYCHLAKLRVSVGELVRKGQLLGTLGRTGKDLQLKRLGTHLRLQVHTFDDGLFYPLYPGRALRTAQHLEWPLKEPDFRRAPRRTKAYQAQPTPIPGKNGP